MTFFPMKLMDILYYDFFHEHFRYTILWPFYDFFDILYYDFFLTNYSTPFFWLFSKLLYYDFFMNFFDILYYDFFEIFSTNYTMTFFRHTILCLFRHTTLWFFIICFWHTTLWLFYDFFRHTILLLFDKINDPETPKKGTDVIKAIFFLEQQNKRISWIL